MYDIMLSMHERDEEARPSGRVQRAFERGHLCVFQAGAYGRAPINVFVPRDRPVLVADRPIANGAE